MTLYILSIGDLSEKFMDFTFDMYFRQFWSDNRLQFNGSNFGIEKLVVGAEYIRLIWVPDTFFVNEKVATFHKATTENQFLRISQSGDVLRSIRSENHFLLKTLAENMNIEYYYDPKYY